MDGLSRFQSEACRDLVRAQHLFVGLVRYGARFDDSSDFLGTSRRLRDQPDRLASSCGEPAASSLARSAPVAASAPRTASGRAISALITSGLRSAAAARNMLMSVSVSCVAVVVMMVHMRCHFLLSKMVHSVRSVKSGTPSLAAGPSDGRWASRVLRGRTRSAALPRFGLCSERREIRTDLRLLLAGLP